MVTGQNDPTDMQTGADVRTDDRTRRAMFALILLVALAVIFAWWLWLQTAVVPDVTGMSASQAKAALTQAGFEPGDIEVDRTALADPGTIDEQGIPGGTRAMKGERVDLFVAGAPEAPEPDLGTAGSGTDIDGFDSQDDDADSIRDRGDDEYYSGTGRKRYRGVPQVLNQTESSAVSELKSAGYTVRIVRAPNAGGIAKGRVFYQTPEPGVTAASGVVEIWISTGAPPAGRYKRPNIPREFS